MAYIKLHLKLKSFGKFWKEYHATFWNDWKPILRVGKWLGGILHFYILVGWSLASGLHPLQWCHAPLPLLWTCGGQGILSCSGFGACHTSFFGQHVRRHYMSKDLHILRWLVWSFGHLSTLRWIYPGKPLAQGEWEAYWGDLIKASPAELIKVSRALADP